jgi:hypothetical protein
MNQEELREEKYNTASEHIQELYCSPVVGTAIRTTFDALGIDPHRYREYVNLFGDAFLGIEKPTSIRDGLRTHFNLTDGTIDGILNRVLASVDPTVFAVADIPQKSVGAGQPQQSAPSVTSEQPLPRSSPLPSSPSPHVPVARVMPQSPEAVQNDPRASTELPNALLQNLKASLMHSAPEEPLPGTNPPPAYNAMLDPKPPAPPQQPPNA